MSNVLKVPRSISKENIFNIMLDIENCETKNPCVILDMRLLKYVDHEGLNYIALLPHYLKILNSVVVIRLPESDNLLSYLEYTGLLNLFFENFTIDGFACIEDFLFLRQNKYSSGQASKARIGIVQPDSFKKFLHNELLYVEGIISKYKFSPYFCSCFYELTKNIFEHSGETIGSFSFHYKTNSIYNECNENCLLLAVSDLGIGISGSLKNTYRKNDDMDDVEYILKSMQRGVSSTGELGRGLGLPDVIESMEEVQITSGFGQVLTREGIIVNERKVKSRLLGTSVSLKLNLADI